MSTRVRGPKAKALLEKRRKEKEADAQGDAQEEVVSLWLSLSVSLCLSLSIYLSDEVEPQKAVAQGEEAVAGNRPERPPPPPPPAAPPPAPPPAAAAAGTEPGDERADQMGALLKDIQSAGSTRPRTTAAAELAKASHRPEALREAAEAVGASLVAAEKAGRIAQLGPGLRVAQALLEAMADGAAASAATQRALEAEPYDLAEQLQRVEALRRKETGAILAPPRFGDALAPAQVRADRALALLGRLRDELSTPPLPAVPKRPLLRVAEMSPASRVEHSSSQLFTWSPATERVASSAGERAVSAAAPPPPPPPPDLSSWGAAEDSGGLDLGGIKQAALFRDIQKTAGQRDRAFEEPRGSSREQMLLDVQRAAARRQQAASSDFEAPSTSSREQMLLDIQRIGAKSGRPSGGTAGPPPLPSHADRRGPSGHGGSPAPPVAPPPPPPLVPVRNLSGWGSDNGSEGESFQSDIGDLQGEAFLLRVNHRLLL